MLNSITYPPYRRYKSRSEWEPVGFFSECLCNAVQFDLMLGFFSSSAINVLSDGFAAFIYNGGKMRLIINDILTEKDRDAIAMGVSSENIPYYDLNDIVSIRETLSEQDTHFFECLAYLIRNNRLEIKIISPKDSYGISHTKSGIFKDSFNQSVSFDGSCNFSRSALIDNIESVTVACSWDGSIEVDKIEEVQQDFENVFNELDSTVNYVGIDDVKTNISNNFKYKELGELLEDECNIIKKKLSSRGFSDSVRSALQKTQELVENTIRKFKEKLAIETANKNTPRFPYPSGPRPYQMDAYNNWKKSQKGLFAMATGTGKTITSLNCLYEIYKKLNYYKAIILVPTITLVNQWVKECEKFNFRNIVKVYSKNKDWENAIASILFQERQFDAVQSSYIVIATYASFAKRKVFSELNQLSGKTLLIADECHNMGAPALMNLMDSIKFKRRIGLSATPKRQFADDVNTKVFEFFDSVKEFTFEYSMDDAINNGVLCPYYYYPHLVPLTEEEMKEYKEVSVKISKYYNHNSDSFNSDPVLTALLLKRKRIVHKACNKLPIFQRILNERYNEYGNLKYSLVFVPEGNDTNDYYETYYYSSTDEDDEDDEAIHLIDVYSKAVMDLDEKITVKKFTANLPNRDEVISQFAKGEIEVLTSMKCLDEGVDVPRSELAIFCASTGNPRQFIQRRGRILRSHPDKKFAYIHDLVVVPTVNESDDNYRMERNMLKKELIRVHDFARLSMNESDTLEELLDTMNYYNLNLYDNG